MLNYIIRRKFAVIFALLLLVCPPFAVRQAYAQDDGGELMDIESLLDSENKDFRESAVKSLCNSSSKSGSTSSLIKALKNSYWQVQYKAVICLGDRGKEKEAGRALMAFLRQDDGSREKLTAATIESIGKTRPTESTWELSKYIKTNSGIIRKAVVNAMISLDDPVALKVLVKTIPHTNCGDVSDSAPYTGAPYLMDKLRSASSSDEKGSVLWAIAKSKAGGQAVIINLLKDPDSNVRTEAAFALGEMGSCDAVAPLAEVGVSDMSPKVRMAAMLNIARIRDSRPPRREADPQYRDAAELVAKGLKIKAGVIAYDNIKSPERDVRLGVAQVALRVKSDVFERVHAYILLAQKDVFPYPMKLEAALQLWDFGGQVTAETFSKALGSFDPEIRIPARAAAAESLGGAKFIMPWVVCGVVFIIMLVGLFLLRSKVKKRMEAERVKMEKAAEAAASASDNWL